MGAIGVASLVFVVIENGSTGLWLAGPWLALVVGACWACFWRPRVVVDDGGVELVNVFRTIDLPWPSINALDTRWALRLYTAYGRYTAWAAPAPSVREVIRATRQDTEHLPADTYSGDGIRLGDLPTSPSGNAALLVRRRWQQLRDAGYLDRPRLERAAAKVTWHWGTIAAGLALVAAGMLGLVV